MDTKILSVFFNHLNKSAAAMNSGGAMTTNPGTTQEVAQPDGSPPIRVNTVMANSSSNGLPGQANNQGGPRLLTNPGQELKFKNN